MCFLEYAFLGVVVRVIVSVMWRTVACQFATMTTTITLRFLSHFTAIDTFSGR